MVEMIVMLVSVIITIIGAAILSLLEGKNHD